MIQILIIMLALILFVSCKKDDKTCNCGKIISDDVTDYSVTIRKINGK